MKISHAVLSLAIIFMGASTQTNAKPSAPLKPSVSTAVKCFNIDEPKCNKVSDECQKSKSKACKAFNKKWAQLVKEDGIDDSI